VDYIEKDRRIKLNFRASQEKTHRPLSHQQMILNKSQVQKVYAQEIQSHQIIAQQIQSQQIQANPTWGLDRIDQTSLPLNQSYDYKRDASNVNVYVIDTGILNSHVEFEGRAQSGIDTIDDDSDSTDCNGHGTHVAGTIGGKTYGVAKKVKLFGVRVLDCEGSGQYSDVIAGVDWVTANHVKPAVVNMSLGGPVSQALDDAIKNSIQAGITYVVAAGNENQDACNSSPAGVAQALTVGSTDSADKRSSFSNHGSCVNIMAPGSRILSATHTSNSATETLSGTSMAAPHVAGVAALYLSSQPQASPQNVFETLRSNSVSNKIGDIKGSSNLLVNSQFVPAPSQEDEEDDDDGDGDDNDGDQDEDGDNGNGDQGADPKQLQNGVENSLVSANQGTEVFYQIQVPMGAKTLEVKISGGSGDADLYLKNGSAPTTSQYDCRPYLSGNDEVCSVNNPKPGVYHLMIRAYRAYQNLKLKATYVVPIVEPGPCPGCEVFSGQLTAPGQKQYQPNGTYYQTLKGSAHKFVLEGPSNADFDIYLQKWNGSQWIEVAKAITSKSNETIMYAGDAGYYILEVRSYSGTGAYKLYKKVDEL
jgi:serine protease